jgi:hypothetical protein
VVKMVDILSSLNEEWVRSENSKRCKQ